MSGSITGWETAAQSLARVEEAVARAGDHAVSKGGGEFERLVTEHLMLEVVLWPEHLDWLVTAAGSPYGPWRCDVPALQPQLRGILNTKPGNRNRAERRAAMRRAGREKFRPPPVR